MRVVSVKVNSACDVIMPPNMSENLLDRACRSSGMVQKMMIDATTPIAPDKRGHSGELLESPKKLEGLIRELQK